MHEQAVVNLLQEKAVFVGTVDGVLPQVRPMLGFIGPNGGLWLLSLVLKDRVALTNNDQAQLCAMGDEGDLLQINGILEPMPFSSRSLPQWTEAEATLPKHTLDADLSVILYRLRVHSVYYTIRDGRTFYQQDEAGKAEAMDGIRLIPGGPFRLKQE